MESAGLCESLSILVVSPPSWSGRKPRELEMLKKMWGLSHWMLDSSASLRKWPAVWAVTWLPDWDGLVSLALNFRDSDKVSGHSLWNAQVVSLCFPWLTTAASITYAWKRAALQGKWALRGICDPRGRAFWQIALERVRGAMQASSKQDSPRVESSKE